MATGVDPGEGEFATLLKEIFLLRQTDNWKHRSKNMRCCTCMWFVRKNIAKEQEVNHYIGRCRRRAPTMNGWPVLYSDDFCGDHKIDEEKI